MLTDANTAVVAARAAGATGLDPAVVASFDQRWQAVLAAGYATNPRPAAGRGDRVVALIDRLRTATTEIWRFTGDFRVPFDNNQAERDIRMVKLQTKVSGCWRTTTGATGWLRIRSYISTLIKPGQHPASPLRRPHRQPLATTPTHHLNSYVVRKPSSTSHPRHKLRSRVAAEGLLICA